MSVATTSAAEEQIAKGICPVKPQYLRDVAPRVAVEAVTGSGAALPESKGKSRRQETRARQASKAAELCNFFLKDSCHHGARCRHSHDVEAYLRDKPRDLPGSCPFSSTGQCQFGITCRWAGSHTYSDAMQDLLVKLKQQQRAPEGSAAQAEPLSEPRAKQPAEDGPSEQAQQAEQTQQAQQAEQTQQAQQAEQTQQAQQAEQTQQAQQAEQTQQAQQAEQTQQAQQVQQGQQAQPAEQTQQAQQEQQPQAGALPQAVELPVSSQIDKVVNVLDRDVQTKLWKSRYDFGRADGILKSMGVRITFKGGGAGDDRGKKKQGAGGGGADKGPQVNAGQPKQGGEPAAEAAAEAAAQQQQPLEPGPEPELKRQRVEGEGAAAGGQGDSGPAGGDVCMGERETAAAAPAADEAAVAAERASAADAGPSCPPTVDGNGTAADGTGPAAAMASAMGTTAAHTGANVAGPKDNDSVAMHVETPLRLEEKKTLDFRGKTYLAPLTTVGNLPFRRVCKGLGADITCGEMALATNLLQGQASEWALLKRHPCEDFFGVQVCGGFPDALARTAQLIDENITVDFVDVNMGCPIDLVCDKSAGSALLLKPKRIEEIARAMSRAMSCPLTLKTRKGYYDGKDVTHTFVPQIRSWGPVALTLHGRTRQQRYSRQADWQYIEQCAELAPDLQLIGNGDVFSYEDFNAHLSAANNSLATCMIGRAALIKPWIFTEIKEQRHWDISASERLDLLKKFCSNGLEHWGSDSRGVENVRRFLLEWLSYLHRYVPVGLLEVVPQQMHWRPPAFVGRSDLETLLSSDNAADWVRISEMLLGPVPAGFTFTPKHKSNAYASSSAGAGDDQAEG